MTPRTTSPPSFFIKGQVGSQIFVFSLWYLRKVLYPLSLAMCAVCVLAKIASILVSSGSLELFQRWSWAAHALC